MHFLIDFENINYAGLEGTEFLSEEDTITFFYSQACKKIVAYRVKDIERSGCKLEVVKLRNQRKNALDFYIASKVGEIFTANHNEHVAIITEDKDLQAVLDYWQPRLPISKQLVKCKSVAYAISTIHDDEDRKCLVQENMKTLDLEAVFLKYEERRRIVEGITVLFEGTDYEPLVTQIVDMVILSEKPKNLYLSSLKNFGRETGTAVYRKLKTSDICA